MHSVLEAEPELQPSGGAAPPATPRRTAVGTDDHEKRPCKLCGHTKAEHLGASCRAQTRVPLGHNFYGSSSGTNVQITAPGGETFRGRLVCGCPRYEPKED